MNERSSSIKHATKNQPAVNGRSEDERVTPRGGRQTADANSEHERRDTYLGPWRVLRLFLSQPASKTSRQADGGRFWHVKVRPEANRGRRKASAARGEPGPPLFSQSLKGRGGATVARGYVRLLL